MRLIINTPAKSLNKAYLRQSIKREQIELFKANLVRLFDRIRTDEHEEHLKNIVADLLKDTWYKPAFEVNTSKRTDLVIHTGKSSDDLIGVIIETKKPSNRAEMISVERPNAKALHELLHYYMQERYIRDNKEIRHLIICNIYEWYIFDAADFERFFFGNKKLVKSYKDWNDGLLVSANTDWFYKEIARPFNEKELVEIPCVCFDLRDFEKTVRNPSKADDKKLIALYKILSPPHLLKQPFANDSNSLNREFYSELLHIIGLEEVKEKGKKLIRRKAEGERYDGSLLENAINALLTRNRGGIEHTASKTPPQENDPVFETALELCINWLDRLLFLKLLEGQLIAYHRGDSAYAFLNSKRIEDFDELNELFFEVLAVRAQERTSSVRDKFGNIPYLNSSLFEESDLERATISINELKNRLDLPLYGATVLKDGGGKRLTGRKNTLCYLFEFLDAYDFSTEGSAEIQEQNKTIINASVLGLIFEKINGYRDGSFFTPGFITMYICRETIRKAILRKFNERYGWNCLDFTGLYNRIDPGMIREANEVVNSLKICDPAVGSGHFLVSALNELIAVKSDLGILADREGRLLRGYGVTVENDEMIVTVDDHIFEYNYRDPESQRVQETLFHEKEAVIENCLFGVDINPKSVAICRLRLWIELLKNAYYRRGTDELETLPNIDINIKCGNSLVSRFALSGDANVYATERHKLKSITERYRGKVWFYKQAPANKAILRKEIVDLKEELQQFAFPTDPDLLALRGLKNELDQLGFGFSPEDMEKRHELMDREKALKERIDEKQRTVYANAFEWRFEFPEVLDEDGEFIGFDAVIGNPPYIRQEAIKDQKPVFAEMFGDFYSGTADIYTYFYKAGLTLLKQGGLLCYIAPNKFMRAGYGRNTRTLLTSEATPVQVLDFGDLPVFEEATTYPSIVMVEKSIPSPPPSPTGRGGKSKGHRPLGEGGRRSDEGDFLAATFTDNEQLKRFDKMLPSIGFTMPVSALKEDGWALERPDVLQLMEKLRKAGKPLGEHVEGKFYRGVLTGLNEAFVIDGETRQRLIAEDPRSAELIKPWLRGRDIRKWKAEWDGLYLITIASSANREWTWSREKSEDAARLLFESAYTSIHRHLSQCEDKLRKRDDQGKFWWELRACVYWEEFEKPKISWSHFATVPEFVYDEERFLSNDKSYIMPTDDLSILGILNSGITNFFIGQLSPPVRGGFMELRKIYLEQLPIPIATDAQKAPIIERVQQILAAPDSPEVPRLEAEIDRLVYELYGLKEEEIALVEGRKP
jgi:hypothetical protein